jgi:hypothetical protein
MSDLVATEIRALEKIFSSNALKNTVPEGKGDNRPLLFCWREAAAAVGH